MTDIRKVGMRYVHCYSVIIIRYFSRANFSPKELFPVAQEVLEFRYFFSVSTLFTIFDCCSERKNILRSQGIRLEITSEERHIPSPLHNQTPPPATIAAAAAADGEKADREIVITGTVRERDRHWEEGAGSKSAAASPQLLQPGGADLATVKSIEEGSGEKKQVSSRLEISEGQNGKP